MRGILFLVFLAAPASAELTRIGAAGAVAGGVSAAAPGGGARSLASGGEVFHNDDVVTDAQGRLQVLLLDQTVFTVGPKSDIVLDEFVYDPFTDTGKVSAKVKQGVFRFVTGKVARKNPAEMKVKLPAGTLGIRGTIAGGKVEGNTSLVALLGPGAGNNADERPGAVIVENAGVSVELDKPGTATRIPGPDLPPTPPFPLTPELLAELSPVPAPRPSAGPAPAAAKGSASDQAGQTTAAGGASALGAIQISGDQQTANSNTAIAAQDTLTGNSQFTSWDQVRAIQSGTAFYEAQGTYSCSGGPCGASDSGTYSLHFNIDFGARTLGGGGQSSHVAFDSTGTGKLNPSPSTFPISGNGTAPVSIQATIPAIGFSALTGQAKLTFGTDFTAANGNAGFNGTSFQFQNGVKQLSTSMVYNGSSDSANISYTAGANASGSAVGSCLSGTPACP